MAKRKRLESSLSDLPTKDLIALLARFSLEEEKKGASDVLQELRRRRVGAKYLTTKAGEVVVCRLVATLPFMTGELIELLTIPALARCAWRRIEVDHSKELGNGLAQKIMSQLRFIKPLDLREEVRARICGLAPQSASRAV